MKPVGAFRLVICFDVGPVSPRAPLESGPGAVLLQDVWQLGWPAVAALHSPLTHAIHDACLPGQHTRDVALLVAALHRVPNTVRLVRLGQILVRLFVDVQFVVETWVNVEILLSDGGQLTRVMYPYVAHDLVVGGGVLVYTEVDHHAEYLIGMEWLLCNLQVQGISSASNHWRLGKT